MNEGLHDPVRHNAWATRHLLEFCKAQSLDEEQRAATGVGTYGTIAGTLDHIVACDGSYVRRLIDVPLPWADVEGTTDLDVLLARADECAELWERFLAEPFDPERVISVDAGAHATRAGIFVAQAINHANHHREQVCAILTGLGIEPPDIQAWEYAWHNQRIWDTPGPTA